MLRKILKSSLWNCSKQLFSKPPQKKSWPSLLWFFCRWEIRNGNTIHIVDFHDSHLTMYGFSWNRTPGFLMSFAMTLSQFWQDKCLREQTTSLETFWNIFSQVLLPESGIYFSKTRGRVVAAWKMHSDKNSRTCDVMQYMAYMWFVFFIIIWIVLFFVVIAVAVFQSSMIALGDFSAYNNSEVFSVIHPCLFSLSQCS